MNVSNDNYSYAPRITFQDTNVVGNVYFLTYFRWQEECLEKWLHDARSSHWARCRPSRRQPMIASWSTRFEDKLGATIGDEVSVAIKVLTNDTDVLSANTEVFKHGDQCPRRIASGTITCDDRAGPRQPDGDIAVGPAYAIVAQAPSRRPLGAIDLFGWQGKCRELFLADHAATTLRRVAERELVLQTTIADLQLVSSAIDAAEQVRVEMRLQSLKCGQIVVRFDYFAISPDGASKHVAKGRQTISSKRATHSSPAPCPLPEDLLLALREFTLSPPLLEKIDDVLAMTRSHRTDVAIQAATRK